MLKMLSLNDIFNMEPNENLFFDFICLHFPEPKVLEIARHLNREEEGRDYIEKRKRTSIWSYRELAHSNSMFLPMMKLISKLGQQNWGQKYFKTLAMIEELIEELNQDEDKTLMRE